MIYRSVDELFRFQVLGAALISLAITICPVWAHYLSSSLREKMIQVSTAMERVGFVAVVVAAMLAVDAFIRVGGSASFLEKAVANFQILHAACTFDPVESAFLAVSPQDCPGKPAVAPNRRIERLENRSSPW